MDRSNAVATWRFEGLLAAVNVTVFLFVFMYGCLSIGTQEFFWRYYVYHFAVVPAVAAGFVTFMPAKGREMSRQLRNTSVLSAPMLYLATAFPLSAAAYILYVFHTTGSYSDAHYAFIILSGLTGNTIGKFVLSIRAKA